MDFRVIFLIFCLALPAKAQELTFEELEQEQSFAGMLTTAEISTDTIRFQRSQPQSGLPGFLDTSFKFYAHVQYGDFQIGKPVCISASSVQQNVHVICDVFDAGEQVRTVTFFSLPDTRVEPIQGQLGAFAFICVRPNCFKMAVGNHTEGVMDILAVRINPIFHNQFIRAVQELRAFRPINQ